VTKDRGTDTVAAADRVYLDWNATTPPHPDVIAAMSEAARSTWGNPSSVHAGGRAARAVLETARETIAAALGAHARDVIFTSGATEANNLALMGSTALVTSRIEHPSVTRVAEVLAERGVPVRWAEVAPTGIVEPEAIERAAAGLEPGFTVAVMAANHETGAIQPIGDLLPIVQAGGGRLHVDAAQAFGKLPLEFWAGADSVAIASHKVRGPKGIGALLWSCGAPPRPVLVGGAQERGLRPGTLDPVAAAGFTAAVARATAGGEGRTEALGPLRDRIERELAPWVEVNASGAPRLPHVASLAVKGWAGDELVVALDLAGVSVSSGSACSAGTPEPPAAVRAMLGEARAKRTIRLSLGEGNTAEQIEHVIDVLKQLVAGDSSRRRHFT
jgi:cysteine desulfurase